MLCILITLLQLKHHMAAKERLIHASWTYKVFKHLSSMYIQALPLTEVQQYETCQYDQNTQWNNLHRTGGSKSTLVMIMHI